MILSPYCLQGMLSKYMPTNGAVDGVYLQGNGELEEWQPSFLAPLRMSPVEGCTAGG